MSGMEAAASLFGSDEQTNDPFALLSQPEPESKQAISAFDTLAADHSAFPVLPSSNSQQTNAYEPYSSYTEQPAAPPLPSSPPLSSPSAPPTAYSPAVQTHETYDTSTHATHSYAPQTYDYAPQSYSQPAHSQYSPPYSGHSSYNQPQVVPPPVVPPPVVPIAPVDRPKVTNAYDPPFPTNRSRKPSARAPVPPPTQSAYTPHVQPPLPQPPHHTSQKYYSSPPPPFQPPPASNPYSPPTEGFTGVPHSSFPPPVGNIQPISPEIGKPPIPAASMYSSGNYVASAPRTSSPLAGTPSNKPPNESALHQTSPDAPKVPQFPPIERSGSPALRYALSHANSHGPINGVNGSTVTSDYTENSGANEDKPPPSDPYSPRRSTSSSSSNPYSYPSGEPSADSSSYGRYQPSTAESVHHNPEPEVSPNSVYSPTPGSNIYQDKVSSNPPPPPQSNSSTSFQESRSHNSAYNPPPPLGRSRTGSNGSLLSATSLDLDGSLQRQVGGEYPIYGNYTSIHSHSLNEDEPVPKPNEAMKSPVQELLASTTISQYAPSPSLMGTNDPLQRHSQRVPVFSFGFGGKIVTCFHGAEALSTGFDVALASRASTAISIKNMKKLIPEAVEDISISSFPGPLFGDTSSSIVAMGSTQTKNKKTKALAYIAGRVEHLSTSINTMPIGSQERGQLEAKLVLLKVLKLLVDNDGRIPPACESAVRSALVPSLASDDSTPSGTFTPAAAFSLTPMSNPLDEVVATNQVKRSSLDAIQSFLLRGQRRQAYHYALDEKLWAHAMIIASSVDRDAWKEVAAEFLKEELAPKVGHTAPYDALKPLSNSSPVNGLEGLKVAYSLYSGQGSAAVQQLVPPNLLSRQGPKLPIPSVSHLTPMTPNFSSPAATSHIPNESLSKWAETLAMMYSNPLAPETSAAITALGDQLLSNGWVEAAHCCYLLAPQTSAVSGLGNPSARIILVGTPSPQVLANFVKGPDSIILSEILELAYSLNSPAKGQEPFRGFPHLQAYRLIRALTLAEMGEIQLSTKYCDAITASLNQPSAYFTPHLVAQLNELANRNAGIAETDRSGSWKLGKPSLDVFGGWLDRGFTKLVTGDPDTPNPEPSKPGQQPFSGPFAHYSSISSATTSASPSPRASVTNLPAFGNVSNGTDVVNPTIQIDRASSAFDYNRKKPSPVHRTASANALTTTFAQSTGYPYTSQPVSDSNPEDDVEGSQEVTWWGSDSYASGSAMATPKVTSFNHVTSATTTSSDGLLSLMDDNHIVLPPAATSTNTRVLSSEEDDEEDLGFGNTKKKDTGGEDSRGEGKDSPDATPKPREEQPPQPETPSGRWFSRFWGGGPSKPAPIKANLGEQSSFYYDKELKKWVNKKDSDSGTSQPAAPPPPPPRSQTVSPGMSGGAGRFVPLSSATPPPPRAASVAEPGVPVPPKSVMRIRSNLTPKEGEAMSAPGTPTGSRLVAPEGPPSRPRSSAAKRPRYAKLA